MGNELPFDFAVEGDTASGEPTFLVDIDGFEGPLDLLLELARRQKVDLRKISILALADQYLHFIETSRRMRLEVAADYLVMAAWLAYLKSRLLLPEPPEDEPPAAELAAEFARRLRRLEAIRTAARHLAVRPQLGRDFFACSAHETLERVRPAAWHASLYDLLSAYARRRFKHAPLRLTVRPRLVWSLAQAREALERVVRRTVDWAMMDAHLAAHLATPELRRTVRASTFSAALEMVREGRLEMQQRRAFAPLWVRACANRPRAAIVDGLAREG